MRTSSPGDVVVVPFPFTDRAASKRRPALVCSSEAYNRHTRHVILAMITTAQHSEWMDDVPVHDLDVAGLPSPSVVRWKLFTLEASFVLRKAGTLSKRDRAACRTKLPVTL
jgi:mRNA interferase MazF